MSHVSWLFGLTLMGIAWACALAGFGIALGLFISVLHAIFTGQIDGGGGFH